MRQVFSFQGWGKISDTPWYIMSGASTDILGLPPQSVKTQRVVILQLNSTKETNKHPEAIKKIQVERPTFPKLPE